MVKKEGDWKGVLKDVVRGEVLFKIKDYVQNAVAVTHKKLTRAITSSALMILGLIFLALGFTFYLTDVLKYTRSSVYLTSGIVLMLISIIIAQSAKLLKY